MHITTLEDDRDRNVGRADQLVDRVDIRRLGLRAVGQLLPIGADAGIADSPFELPGGDFGRITVPCLVASGKAVLTRTSLTTSI